MAGVLKNPTGWAVWKDKNVETNLIYTDDEILNGIMCYKPIVVAIDAPLSLPKEGILRKADRDMVRRGYRVFPPGLPAMKELTLRAVKLSKLIKERGCEIIEVHPTSTRKALGMPLKDWIEIQSILSRIGLRGTLSARALTPHELDAITAALTAYLYVRNEAEALGDDVEGYIIVPKTRDWRTLQI